MLESTRKKLERKTKNHAYLDALAKQEGCTLAELYAQHQDILTNALKSQLFYILRKRRKIRKKRLEKK